MTEEERQKIVDAVGGALEKLEADEGQAASMPSPEEFALMVEQAVDADIRRRIATIKAWFRTVWGAVFAVLTVLAVLVGLLAGLIKIYEFFA